MEFGCSTICPQRIFARSWRGAWFEEKFGSGIPKKQHTPINFKIGLIGNLVKILILEPRVTKCDNSCVK
jgi:hypothetical protein